MSYDYKSYKHFVFDEEHQADFLAIRDRVRKLLREAGAVRMQEIMKEAGAGDSFVTLACVDRLVELKEIKELTRKETAGQFRVFIAVEEDYANL
jgi:hypothetical protein